MPSAPRVVWSDQVAGMSLRQAQTGVSYGNSSTGVFSSALLGQQVWSGPSDRVTHQGSNQPVWSNLGLNGGNIASTQGPPMCSYQGVGTLQQLFQTSFPNMTSSVYQPVVSQPITFPHIVSQGHGVQTNTYSGLHTVQPSSSQRQEDQCQDAERTVSLLMCRRGIERLREFIRQDLLSAFQDVNRMQCFPLADWKPK